MTGKKSVDLKRSTPITSSFKALNHGSRWKNLLRNPQDKFMQTVKLEGAYADHNRYLCIVNHANEKYAILGVDEDNEIATIGLIVKIIHGMSVSFDGDGGFTYHQNSQKQFIFKPVSVQALWTVIQSLHMIAERLQPTTNNDKEDWISKYEITSNQSYENEWHVMADLLVRRPPSPHRTPKSRRNRFEASQEFEIVMKSGLRQIMKSCNLDTITSKKIRTQLEGALGQSLEDYKSFIDKEILVILGQMDPASQILDYLYLGSEWNASNLEELKATEITHILNVTREIDNFFPADFKYKNVRVYDEEATDLLRYFDETYRFIKEAKEQKGKILVHCKMGISRSATCTISFIMKEYGKDLKSALIHAKEKRSIVNPNKGFIKQLEVYEGILGAFRHRQIYHSPLFRSKSESSIPHQEKLEKSPTKTINVPICVQKLDCEIREIRPKSWSPNEKIAHFLMDQADRLSKSATADNVIDDCSCLTETLAETLTMPHPVNSCTVIDPNHDCNVELELSVPTEPVTVTGIEKGDNVTDVIVQSLSQLNMRNNSSLLEDLQRSSGSSSVSSSVPTTPIFSLKRRSSVDSAFSALKVPQAPPLPPVKNEVLSVKTLANMFDFKVPISIPFRPCSARLEDNHIFQRMAKQLDNDNETDC